MDNIMRDVTGVAMAIIGVALLYTLVNKNNDTASVISAATGGFSNALMAAMGGGNSQKSTVMGS